MANHRAQAQFQRAKWRLRLLGPLWGLQLSLSMALMGLFAWRLGDTLSHYKDRKGAGKKPVIEFVWETTNIGLSFIIAVCTFFEIGRYVAEALTPWTMLFTHVIKLTCASAILALDVVIYVQRRDAHYSLVALGLDCALMATAIALAIYTIRAYRRLSTYDDYQHPVNVKPYGFNDGLQRDNSYSSKLSGQISINKRGSFGSARLSIGSINDPVPMNSLEQSRRYSHERDTQFDEYLNRRGSTNMKGDAERGIGRTSPPGEAQGDLANSRTRGPSFSRGVSWSADHVLVAVPEEEGDVADGANRRPTDQDALLGQNRRVSIGDDYEQHRGPAVPQEVDVAEPRWQRE